MTHGRTRTSAAAVAGAVAAVFGAGLGELSAALIAPASSPFAVVGGMLIDIAPRWAKDAMIALFDTGDKVALLTLIALVLVGVFIVAGMGESRRAPTGQIVAGLVGAVAAVLALTRSDAGLWAWAPSAIAGVTAVIAMRLLVRLATAPWVAPAPTAPPPALSRAVSQSSPPPTPLPPGVDDEGTREAGLNRRRFLVWTSAAGAIGVFGAVVGTLTRAGSQVLTTVRDAVRLPSAATAAADIPAGAVLDVPGISPLVTPNADFYRIDTALTVPQIDPAEWELRIHGLVDREVRIGWEELLALPLEESYTTLLCVSNPTGGPLAGNALWLGYPVRLLLERAGVHPAADMVLSRSIDGFTASTPLEALTDERNAIFAVGMNGEPLPAEHGFPVRMVVPGLYGYVSATKWVVELEVTRFEDAIAYWTARGWAPHGPIKLGSRIDVPRPGDELPSGEVVIAGVAWQPHTAITGVEVRIDEGPWMPADLAPAISEDTWVQWSYRWDAPSGEHLIRCRAINADGEVQTERTAAPAPNGATGHHRVTVYID